MISGIYAATSGLHSNQLRLEVTQSNLANVSVPGFRRGRIAFQSFADVLREHSGGPAFDKPVNSIYQMGGGVMMTETWSDPSTGALRQTGRKTDLAIEGDGFFAIQTDEGIRYTRNGTFARTADGFLTTPDGRGTLLDGWYDPVTIQGGAATDEINILPNGAISYEKSLTGYLMEPAGEGQLGQMLSQVAPGAGDRDLDDFAADGAGSGRRRPRGAVGVWAFENPNQLVRLGESQWRIPEGSDLEPMPSDAVIRQGFLEQSNVNVTDEMVNLIGITRNYEQNQRVIQILDGTLDQAVNNVARI